MAWKAEDSSLVVLEGTVAGTVWIAGNSKGAITIMKPEDD